MYGCMDVCVQCLAAFSTLWCTFVRLNIHQRVFVFLLKENLSIKLFDTQMNHKFAMDQRARAPCSKNEQDALLCVWIASPLTR